MAEKARTYHPPFPAIILCFGFYVHVCHEGKRYCSRKYQSILNEYHITGSMSKPGCPYDNSCMERFFASMKMESPAETESELPGESSDSGRKKGSSDE